MAKYNPFNTIQMDAPSRNSFDLSFDNKLTLDMGPLYPILAQETIPGDIFNITPEMLIRFAPMTFPIMHRIDATIHFFYVPNRIMWSNWTKFIAGENYVPLIFNGQTDEPENALAVTSGSLWDYFGLPNNENIQIAISAFPFLAYWRIYNEYYQDQNNDTTYVPIRDLLQEIADTKNGLLLPADFDPLFDSYTTMGQCAWRAWEHDYFTSALPFAQRGDAVNIPVTLTNLTGDTTITQAWKGIGVPADDGTMTTDTGFIGTGGTPADISFLTGTTEIDGTGAELEGTINQLRIAMQLQKFLEKSARSGTRYNELIMAYFGEDIGDARISRPEYIGGIKNNIVISEVLQTSSTTDSSALGDYAGHATGVVNGNNISYKCLEHGWIIGILSVIPKPAYFQGVNKKFLRQTYLDFYWKEFAQIGEQSIQNQELYYSNTDPEENEETFGYIPRYSEYKYNASEVHGNFRDSLLDFHLARDFETRPALNQEFIYVDPGQQKRIFAVTDLEVNSLYAHIYLDIRAQRKIPFFTNPGGL